MKKKTGAILIIVLIYSCAVRNTNQIIGHYKSQKSTNRIKATLDYYLSGKIYVLDSLSINKDSTFRYKISGNTMTGNWKTKNDSLVLFIKTNRFNIDSLNYSKRYPKDTVTFKKPMSFKILNSKLRTEATIKHCISNKIIKKVYIVLEKAK